MRCRSRTWTSEAGRALWPRGPRRRSGFPAGGGRALLLAAALAGGPVAADAPPDCDAFLAVIDRTGRIGAAIPDDLPPEERCRRMPPRCGRGFTDNGRAWSWYYRSVCFEALAMERLDPALCDEVVERPSFLADGSYYSPLACRARIAERLSDRAAGPMAPGDMARIAGVEAALGDGLAVTLRLEPAAVGGRYAVALGLAYVDAAGAEVYRALNPEGVEWSDALDRLSPVTGWHVGIPPGQEALTLTIAPRHLDEALAVLERGGAVSLEVALQALVDEEGRTAAPGAPRSATVSRSAVAL